MNAVIAMCTFCEMHGPRVIFTTQTYRTFDQGCVKKMRFYGPKEIMTRRDAATGGGGGGRSRVESGPSLASADGGDPRRECDGCESLGDVKYLSNEHESRTSFLSARQALNEETDDSLKHACVRSLSCEVHLGEEGVCYFGDERRGHVLSHAFALKDSQARGIRRSCSFIVFMRDKQFLLNMWPFLVDNLRQVIRELQEYAEIKYRADEAENPQRSARLASANAGPTANRHASRGNPRGLSEITNEKHVFVRIHMWLVWILSAGGRHLVEVFPNCDYSTSDTERISDDCEDDCDDDDDSDDDDCDDGDDGDDDGDDDDNGEDQEKENADERRKERRDSTRAGRTGGRRNRAGRSGDSKTRQRTRIEEFEQAAKKSWSLAVVLRKLAVHLSKHDLRQLLYASMTGIQVLVRGAEPERLDTLYALSRLVPRACRRINIRATEYTEAERANNFVGVESTVAVPSPCSTICRLEIIEQEHRSEATEAAGRSRVVRWAGSLPQRLPTLLLKIEKSLDNDRMSDGALRAHLAALHQEWTNIARVLHAMRARGAHRADLSRLMMSLGAGPHDQKLLDAWSMALPSNPA